MEQDKSMTNPEPTPSFSIIAIPEHLREQVRDFVAQLAREDEEVSGYMLHGTAPSSINAMRVDTVSNTGCTVSDTGWFRDVTCYDTD